MGVDGGTRAELCGATFPNIRLRAVVGDDGGTERSDSGATPFRIFDLGWRLGTMVVPEWSVSGTIPFRTFYIGWLVGVDGGCPERSFAERRFPNFQLRVVGGD